MKVPVYRGSATRSYQAREGHQAVERFGLTFIECSCRAYVLRTCLIYIVTYRESAADTSLSSTEWNDGMCSRAKTEAIRTVAPTSSSTTIPTVADQAC